ncbi:hexose kinase [Virgibacillus sp. NKC19-3]|uniref:hexose kinase n=1 Tax=Virgibacillus saliphilus TaxID=2831674 RepID=UPI001C9B31A6|nr:hexose kinase [Virgibacillus sp. NKC19-3]MBY7142872.1 hexose kinase [Virgibacillus sp. NKC19-3]
MILTITLNPSVDISYKPNTFTLDSVTRVKDVSKTAGGKGLNVSRVLQQLGESVAATGFLGGSLGKFISKEITAQGIQDYFIGIDGETRNCIAIIHDGQQTELLEAGPTILEQEETRFLNTFSEYARQAEIVTISGSLPQGLAIEFYQKIIEIATSYDSPVLLDTKGELLKSTLKGKIKPYLIKPNQDELGDLFGRKLIDESDVVKALKSELFLDVPWIVVTLGADGAFVKHKNMLYRVYIPPIDAINPVGSGDSVIAGFAAGISRGYTDKNLIKFGLAMGVLNAIEEKTGYVDPENIEWCVGEMDIIEF